MNFEGELFFRVVSGKLRLHFLRPTGDSFLTALSQSINNFSHSDTYPSFIMATPAKKRKLNGKSDVARKLNFLRSSLSTINIFIELSAFAARRTVRVDRTTEKAVATHIS